MFNDFILWFDRLSVIVIIIVGILLILVEYFIRIQFSFNRANKILINLWQVFGVLLPAFWMLRASENYVQVALMAIMIIYFGIYKPGTLRKTEKKKY